jgi:7-cyano-7-deazaguanine synthase
MKTIVVLSGGMDSTTLLYNVLKDADDNRHVGAISFDYGQRHKIELKKAAKTCTKLNIDHKVIDITSLNSIIKGSALTDDIDVPEGHYKDASMKLTVVPNRNAIMANIAIGYAVSLNFDRVALGVHAGDHAIYPDCRPLFIKALNVLADVANYKPIEIFAPYLNLSKGEIVKRGLDLNVDFGLTHTCYNGKEVACGKCGSCVERVLSFDENDLVDPIEYEMGWEKTLDWAERGGREKFITKN